MVRYVMTLILDVGRNMTLIMTLNIYLITLKKVLEINYTYGYLKRPTEKNILWRVIMFFISHRMGDGDELFIAKLG